MSRKLLPEKKSLQIKKSEKTHKKKVCSLRHQLEFFFIGLLVVSMCTITAINFLFLERYYITKKTEVLEAAVNDLQKLKIVTDAEGNSTAEISDSLKRECSENNLTWTIITVDGKKYILEIIPAEKNFVEQDEEKIYIYCKKSESADEKKKVLEKWFREKISFILEKLTVETGEKVGYLPKEIKEIR